MKHRICVVGLGYVGLPLAIALSKKFPTYGFDIDNSRISELRNSFDRTNELSADCLQKSRISFTDDPTTIKRCNFIIVSVPTPVTSSNKPDLGCVISATKTVGWNLSRGSIVVYESTVYPGVTEEVCIPVLEKMSGLVHGTDFKTGYSPERINPGDKTHTIDKIVKIVSGSDAEALSIISGVYSAITKAGVYKAPSIKVAEAAKVIENIQRDLNIALMNELSLIFERMDIDTNEVIRAASTKWNFAPYFPGMVGGHCIGVDPYYLTHKAQQLGYNPAVILAGRGINNYMPIYISKHIISLLRKTGKRLTECTALIMGLSFKENVPDIRNSKAKDIIGQLKKRGVNVIGHDPLVKPEQVKKNFGIENLPFPSISGLDCIIMFSPHHAFCSLKLSTLRKKCNRDPILLDIKSFFRKEDALREGFLYKSL